MDLSCNLGSHRHKHSQSSCHSHFSHSPYHTPYPTCFPLPLSPVLYPLAPSPSPNYAQPVPSQSFPSPLQLPMYATTYSPCGCHHNDHHGNSPVTYNTRSRGRKRHPMTENESSSSDQGNMKKPLKGETPIRGVGGEKAESKRQGKRTQKKCADSFSVVRPASKRESAANANAMISLLLEPSRAPHSVAKEENEPEKEEKEEQKDSPGDIGTEDRNTKCNSGKETETDGCSSAANERYKYEQLQQTRCYYLHNWCIQMVKNILIVHGLINDRERRWHSGRVMRVQPPGKLFSKSGSVYYLLGPPDESFKEHWNLSEDSFQLFHCGLPGEDWVHLCLKDLNQYNSAEFVSVAAAALHAVSGIDTTVPAVKTSSRVEEEEDTEQTSHSDKESLHNVGDDLVSTEDGTVKEKDSVNGSQKGPKLKEFSIITTRSPMAQSLLDDSKDFSISTPMSSFSSESFVSSLKRSSRGRILKPVLHNLVDKFCTYSYDTKGELLGLSSPVIDLTSDDTDTSTIAKKPLSRGKTIPRTRNTSVDKKSMETSCAKFPVKVPPVIQGSRKGTNIAAEKSKEKEERVCSTDSSPPKERKKTRRTRRIVPPTKKPAKVAVPQPDKEKKTANVSRRKGKGTRKAATMVKSRRAYSESDVDNEGNDEVSFRRRTRSSIGNLSTIEQPPAAINWTAEDTAKLKKVVSRVPALSDNFWTVVCKGMGSRQFTPAGCQKHYMEMGRDPEKMEKKTTSSKKNTKADTTTDQGSLMISGGPGTMKRKRQLRNALDSVDSNYHDNLFDSTPMQKKARQVSFEESCLSGIESGSGEEEEEESGIRHTPRLLPKEKLGAVIDCTPRIGTAKQLDTTRMRHKADPIIYRYQHLKRPLPGKKPHPSNNKQSTGGSKNLKVASKNLKDIRTGEQKVFKLFDDSETSEYDSDHSATEEHIRKVLRSFN